MSSTVGAPSSQIAASAFVATPNSPAYSASLSLDVSQNNDHQIGVLTGNIAFTLTNGAAGMAGTILIKQDATGSRTVTFTAAGFTNVKNTLDSDTQPQSAANSITEYSYRFFTVGGTNYLAIGKTFLG